MEKDNNNCLTKGICAAEPEFVRSEIIVQSECATNDVAVMDLIL